jgi:hypothetical protein
MSSTELTEKDRRQALEAIACERAKANTVSGRDCKLIRCMRAFERPRAEIADAVECSTDTACTHGVGNCDHDHNVPPTLYVAGRTEIDVEATAERREKWRDGDE